jgi:hypothetical protein
MTKRWDAKAKEQEKHAESIRKILQSPYSDFQYNTTQAIKRNLNALPSIQS